MFNELNQKIKETNISFNKVSNQEKVVMLAQDVLYRISIQNLIPKNGDILDIGPFFKYRKNKSIKSIINTEKCIVCAKGALFCAYIGRVNKLKIGDYEEFNNYKDIVHQRLEELISLEQLDLIEIAFEGKSYLRICKNSDLIVTASNYFTTYVNPLTRLKAIMKNIISNNGVFKPI